MKISNTGDKHSSTSKVGSRSAKLRRRIRRAIKRGQRMDELRTGAND